MKTVLIVRLSAIGDIVMASPVAAALKANDPATRVIWLTQPECSSLVQHNPLIDEVITWPRKQWQELWQRRQFGQLFSTIREFRQMLKSKQIDTAIDLQGLLKSGVLAALSGAKQTIGLGSKEGSQWLMDQVIERDRGDTDLIGSEYRWLCQQLNLNTDRWSMTLGASEQAQSNAQALQQTIGEPYIVICPFTTRPQKHWPDEHWRALIPKLIASEATAAQVVMLGGPGDIEHANRLCTDAKVINLVGKTQLPEAALLIKHAQALVGVDTGLTHMGHAFNIPTVALFGSTRPYLKTDSHNGAIIYLDKHCAPCKRKPSCNGRFDCLNDISAEQVLNRLHPLLAGRTGAIEVTVA